MCLVVAVPSVTQCLVAPLEVAGKRQDCTSFTIRMNQCNFIAPWLQARCRWKSGVYDERDTSAGVTTMEEIIAWEAYSHGKFEGAVLSSSVPVVAKSHLHRCSRVSTGTLRRQPLNDKVSALLTPPSSGSEADRAATVMKSTQATYLYGQQVDALPQFYYVEDDC